MDKLVIENIKIATIKQVFGDGIPEDQASAEYQKMMTLNTNRSTLVSELNRKIESVIAGKEPNRILETIKTYDSKTG